MKTLQESSDVGVLARSDLPRWRVASSRSNDGFLEDRRTAQGGEFIT